MSRGSIWFLNIYHSLYANMSVDIDGSTAEKQLILIVKVCHELNQQ